jgi:pilus assembly protein CpaF
MGLRDRLKGPAPALPGAPPATGALAPPASAGARSVVPTGSANGQTGQTGQWSGITNDIYQNLKHELHQKLIEKLDLRTIEKLPREQLRDELRAILSNLLQGTELPLNRQEREHMVEELLDEVTGLGPLEPLLRDQAISDILVNKFDTIYIEKFGKLELTNVRFRDNEHLTQIINRIVSRVGRRVDDSSPMADARLADGSRVNAIIAPLALDGSVLSIRRFGGKPLRFKDMLGIGSITPEMVGFLGAAVKAKCNVLISGGTGTGKTTMLNALSSFIPDGERVITIEDAAELQLQQRHVVRLETRPPNIEGRGEVLARDLVKNALRMRPDRIVIGECRGGEILDMLQAMNTGHEGSMTTVHANTARDALSRIEAMVGMGGVTMSEILVRQTISRAINLVVQLTRGTDGKRRITSVSEITGMEGSVITQQDIFKFEQRGTDKDGKILGEYRPTGVRPKIMERLERYGINPAEVVARVIAGN